MPANIASPLRRRATPANLAAASGDLYSAIAQTGTMKAGARGGCGRFWEAAWIRRFRKPRRPMASLGPVRSERSTGDSVRRDGRAKSRRRHEAWGPGSGSAPCCGARRLQGVGQWTSDLSRDLPPGAQPGSGGREAATKGVRAVKWMARGGSQTPRSPEGMRILRDGIGWFRIAAVDVGQIHRTPVGRPCGLQLRSSAGHRKAARSPAPNPDIRRAPGHTGCRREECRCLVLLDAGGPAAPPTPLRSS